MKYYSNTEYPKRAKCVTGELESFSVDVFTIDDLGLLNIGYYDFESQKWEFHTDTLSDMYENGELQNFIWMYPPEDFKTKSE